jgi:hypothetical protein
MQSAVFRHLLGLGAFDPSGEYAFPLSESRYEADVAIQLASSFTNFFDKLIEILQKVADRFPYYDEIAALAKAHPSTRMKLHLERLYGDLLRFFQDVAQVFASGDGSTLRIPLPNGYQSR